MKSKMKNRTTRFLTASLIFISVLCILIFGSMMFFMNQKSRETIGEIGRLYMSGISERIADHFNTIITTRFSYVKAVTEYTPPEGVKDLDDMRRSLVYSAEIRGFEYLALATENGVGELLYGSQLELVEQESFLAALENGESKVTVGIDSGGNRTLVLGIPAAYPMEDGGKSVAMVAGMPIDDVKNILALDEEDALVFSHVLLKDGTFVIRSGDAFRDNFFDRIRAMFDEYAGKNAEQYVEELTAAMEEGADYSVEFRVSGERRYLYCIRLPYCDWYLLTIMPYGPLDERVTGLSHYWLQTAIEGCGILLLALLAVFMWYFSLSRRQIRELSEARQVAESASRSKSEFLSNMSHDIRTPMNAIVGMTAIAAANMDKPEQVQECLKKITMSSKHLLGLINDVLDMSKIESGKMTLNQDRVSLREIVDSIVSIVQPQVSVKKQKFDVFIHDVSAESVLCDGVRLNQVLLNLLSNAIKFTPEGGKITMSLWERPSPKGSDYIRICLQVKDTGIGMSEEFQGKIFESFAREDRKRVHHTEGTGLGMTITKYIVDAMDGSIEVKSRQGEGTEFNLVLDFERLGDMEAEMHLPGWWMLVVDDDRQLCESAVESLESIGVHAEWALDGESAMKMVGNRHKMHDDYQVILLDWKLPGMDGIETAREIRRRFHKDIPIILISAYDWSEIEEEAREAGIDGFIAKPLFRSTLFYGLKAYAEDGILKEPEETPADFSGRRVLLAEDNELNWEVAEELLKELGLTLEWAENGKICVEKFLQSPVGFYDAVLMDIRMPVMTGYEATDAIRASGRADADIPILAMTADAFSEDRQRCLNHGMNGHIAKPIEVGEIARLLEKCWEERDAVQ